MADCLDCDKAAAYAALLDEEAPDVDPRGDELTRWSGLIAPYGKPTGDKRRFAVGSLENRPFPLPLKWQREDGAGHSRSVVIGTIEGADYSDDGVQAWGILLDPDPTVMPRLAEDVAEARLLLEKGAIGPSVDLSKMEFHQLDASEFAEGDPVEGRPEIEVTQGEFGAVTLVAIPAFAEARPFALEKIKVDAYEAMVASAAAEIPVRTDWSGVPVAFVDWAPHEFLLQEFADEALVAGAFLEQDTGTFPVAMIVDGELSLVPGAVAEAIAVVARHEDQLPLSAAVRGTLKRTLGVLAERCELPPPPWSKAALVASGVPLEPPREWFETPEADAPTPITVTDDGRVFGHIADWRTCHTGFANQCVTAPRSASGYAYAHTGAVKTADGAQVTVGRLTVGGGHASTAPGVGFRAALEHYDDASTTAAIGRFKDGKHGIWFSGAVVPEATPQQIAQLRRHPPSGDWRTVGGTRELILAHSVNAPGFPVVSAGMVRGEVTSMVAAGALVAEGDDEDAGEPVSFEYGGEHFSVKDINGHLHGPDGKFIGFGKAAGRLKDAVSGGPKRPTWGKGTKDDPIRNFPNTAEEEAELAEYVERIKHRDKGDKKIFDRQNAQTGRDVDKARKKRGFASDADEPQSRQDAAVAVFAEAARASREYKAGMPFFLKKKIEDRKKAEGDSDDDEGGKGEPFGGKKAKPFGKGGKK